MHRLLKFTLLVGGMFVAALALAACSSRDDEPGPAATNTPATTPTPTLQSQTPATPTGTATPDSDDEPDGPVVVWIVADHAGAGALTVRLETNVETTAEISTFRSSPDAPGFPPEVSGELATHHAVSIPTGMEDFGVEVVVTDAEGRKATATLELGTIVGRQYWARTAGAAPAIARTGTEATVTWTNLRSAGEPDIPGMVLLFAKRAGCTTAEACVGELVETFEDDSTGGDAVVETHEIAVTFPDTEHDFQVVLVGRPGAESAVRMFYQFEVRAFELAD